MAEQSRLFKIARQKALANLLNETLLVTLPYSVSSLPVTKYSASKALNKSAVTKQKKRIKNDILGEDGKGKTATIAGDGSILKSSVTGKSRMPLVVPKKGRGRRKNTAQPQPVDILKSGEEVRRWLKENTYLAWRRGSATRIKKRGTKLTWVEKSALAAAAAYLVGTFGGLLSGWSALAAKVGNNKLPGILAGRTKRNAPGSVRISDQDEKISVSAKNEGLPAVPTVKKYQSEQVDKWIPKKWEYAIVNECQYALIALNKFIRKLK